MLDRALVPTPKGQVEITRAATRLNPGTQDGGHGTPTTIEFPAEADATGPAYFLHELGHAYDRNDMTPAARRRFMAILHMGPAATWWGDSPSPGYDPWDGTHGDQGNNAAGEKFAELYRVLGQHRKLLGSKRAWNNYRRIGNSSYEYMYELPHYFQMRKIAKLIDSVG